MKILKEKEVTMYNLDCAFSKEERETLFDYALNNIPKSESVNLLIEWAFIDILKKQMANEIKAIKSKKANKPRRR